MPEDRQRRVRLDGRQLVAVVAALLVAVTAAVGLVRSRAARTAAGAPASAPAWRGIAPCRQDPMAHVPHPTRFVILANCSMVSGTVKQVGRDPADGEVNMLIEVDRPYARFLAPGNRGLLPTAAVPRDVPKLGIPRAGQHATFYGAWVLDRNQRNLPAMHPVWMIKPSPGRAGAEPSSTPKAAAGRLEARMQAPRSVALGGELNVSIKVESVHRKARRPLPGAHLFLEVSGRDGRGVQWKAASTNALGVARVTLVALEHPGSFRLWLYADKLGRSAVVSTPFRVRRR